MKKILSSFFALIIILGVIGCTQRQTQPPKEPITVQIGSPGQQQIQEPAPAQAPQQEEIKEFHIEMKQFEFTPSTINVNRGEKVRLHITSLDVTHGFSLPDFSIDTGPVASGQTIVKEFTADKIGSFPFKCSVYCGSGHQGMKGMLIVNP